MVTPPRGRFARLWHGSSTDWPPCVNCDGSKQAKTECGRVDGAPARRERQEGCHWQEGGTGSESGSGSGSDSGNGGSGKQWALDPETASLPVLQQQTENTLQVEHMCVGDQGNDDAEWAGTNRSRAPGWSVAVSAPAWLTKHNGPGRNVPSQSDDGSTGRKKKIEKLKIENCWCPVIHGGNERSHRGA